MTVYMSTNVTRHAHIAKGLFPTRSGAARHGAARRRAALSGSTSARRNKLEFHDANTDTDFLVTIFADTSDTRD